MISDSPIILTEFTAMKKCELAHSHLFYNSPVFKNWFILSKRIQLYQIMDARGKFGEHERRISVG